MKENLVGNLLGTTMEKVREMVDVNTIIGEPITVDGATIIPVSKVTYGFTSGGTDLPSKSSAQLFGGAGGAGITINPTAFIVVNNGTVRLMQISNFTSSADRAIGMIPELVDKISDLVGVKNSGKDSGDETVASDPTAQASEDPIVK